ncbi:MAG: enoyl-CoA hydratase-related protein [Microthrixaceae bacterium]
MAEPVRLDVAASGVATITLDNPKVNALSEAVLARLGEIVADVRSGSAGPVRTVVVTGGPRLFAAGADIAGFAVDPSPDTFELARGAAVERYGAAFLDTFEALAALEMPTIASISGYALGGGLELALACDLRIASDRATLGLPELLLGIIPGGGGTQRLARLIGPSRAKSLIFTGRQVRADEALQLGLVDEVVPADELDGRVAELAGRLASGAPNALACAKAAVDEGLDVDLAEGLRIEQRRFVQVFDSEDATIGVRSFLESGPGHADFTSVERTSQ